MDWILDKLNVLATTVRHRTASRFRTVFDTFGIEDRVTSRRVITTSINGTKAPTWFLVPVLSISPRHLPQDRIIHADGERMDRFLWGD